VDGNRAVWGNVLCLGEGGLIPVSPPGQQRWSPLVLYKGVLRHWWGPQPGGLQRLSLLPAALPARCGTGECGSPVPIFLCFATSPKLLLLPSLESLTQT
jgi:hypothetical protein